MSDHFTRVMFVTRIIHSSVVGRDQNNSFMVGTSLTLLECLSIYKNSAEGHVAPRKDHVSMTCNSNG